MAQYIVVLYPPQTPTPQCRPLALLAPPLMPSDNGPCSCCKKNRKTKHQLRSSLPHSPRQSRMILRLTSLSAAPTTIIISPRTTSSPRPEKQAEGCKLATETPRPIGPQMKTSREEHAAPKTSPTKKLLGFRSLLMGSRWGSCGPDGMIRMKEPDQMRSGSRIGWFQCKPEIGTYM